MAYFGETMLYMILISQVLSVPIGTQQLLLAIVVCFLIMFYYGNSVYRKSSKPESLLRLYLPIFLPLFWYMFCASIFNFLNISISTIAHFFLGFFTLNIFGMVVSERNSQIALEYWHTITTTNLIYYGSLILGFTAGERLAARKTKHASYSISDKIIILALFLDICAVYLSSEFFLYQRHQTVVTSAEPYGFNYAGGYSSIDLHPYYVENEENILVKLEEPSSLVISDWKEMPILDGAEAAYPVYSAFANACYENIAEIQKTAKESKSDSVMPIQFTNTVYAYEKLLTGEIDIFFGAKPSKEQLKMAKKAGVELVLTPIGKEAFVFFVSDENPVDELSSEQIRDIYSGEINNWRKVGGKNQRILPFQRPENSGSQTMMEYFMGNIPLREPLEAEFKFGMGGLVRAVADYENSASSLGYSFRYYTTIMMAEADSEEAVAGIKLLAVDGVYPDTETIRSGEYPYTTELYAITVANRTIKKNSKSTIEPFLAWMTGSQGQQIVESTGYVALE